MITNEELVALIRDVAAKIEEAGPDDAASLVLPLRLHAQPGCHTRHGNLMDSSDAGQLAIVFRRDPKDPTCIVLEN